MVTLNLLYVWWIRYNSTLQEMYTSIAFSSTKFQLTKQVIEFLLITSCALSIQTFTCSPSSQMLLSKFNFLETYKLIIFSFEWQIVSWKNLQFMHWNVFVWIQEIDFDSNLDDLFWTWRSWQKIHYTNSISIDWFIRCQI